MTVLIQNHKWDKRLSRIGLNWWRRMRFSLWLHFLPHRTLCLFLRHNWKEPWPVIDDGPLHLPPRERYWRMLAYHSQCERCANIKNIPYTKEMEEQFIEEGIEDAEREWNHPEIREVLQQLKFEDAAFN